MTHRSFARHLFIIFALLGLLSSPALAYIGPGSGLSAIGAFLAAVVGLMVAIFGFVWYPIKRLRKKWRASKEEGEADSSE